MEKLDTLLHRLKSIVRWIARRDRAEQDLNDELQTFVDMAAADEVRSGATAAEAHRRAWRLPRTRPVHSSEPEQFFRGSLPKLSLGLTTDLQSNSPVVAKRLDGVDVTGAPSGRGGGGDRRKQDHDRYADERQRVERIHTKEKRRDQPA